MTTNRTRLLIAAISIAVFAFTWGALWLVVTTAPDAWRG